MATLPEVLHSWLSGGSQHIDPTVVLKTGDIEIGAVEIKDATTANRVVVSAQGSIPVKTDQTIPGTTDLVSIATGQGAGATLGVTTGAAVVTDANGTIQQYLRGVVKLLVDKVSVKIDQTTPGTTNKVVADPVTATPTVYNVTLTSADTEYSQAMVANCRRFEFQCRTSADVRFAFVTGKVATPTAPYMTLKAGDSYDSGLINQGAAPSTLYLASATAGVIAEIISWA